MFFIIYNIFGSKEKITDYDYCFKLIRKNKLKEVMNYKRSFIPNILYQHY